MPRKSKSTKSSKKKKSSKARNLKSSEDVKVSETNVIAKQIPDECASASIQSENCDLKALSSDRSKSETYVSYGSSFELNKTDSSPENSDFGLRSPSPGAFISIDESPVSSKSGEPPVISNSKASPVRSESIELPVISKSIEPVVRSKSAELPVESKPDEPPLRKILSEPILRSELTEEAIELLFTQLTIRRRQHFLCLLHKANYIVGYMEFLVTIRKDNAAINKVVNNRWKQSDASDWFRLLSLWDSVQDNIHMFIAVLRFTYNDFHTDSIISTTIENFYAFVEDLVDIFDSIGELLKICINCYRKFSRFCVTNNESTFLKNVSNYRPNFALFRKNIKIELDRFTTLRDFIEVQQCI